LRKRVRDEATASATAATTPTATPPHPRAIWTPLPKFSLSKRWNVAKLTSAISSSPRTNKNYQLMSRFGRSLRIAGLPAQVARGMMFGRQGDLRSQHSVDRSVGRTGMFLGTPLWVWRREGDAAVAVRRQLSTAIAGPDQRVACDPTEIWLRILANICLITV
jgi:hypothetical protein